MTLRDMECMVRFHAGAAFASGTSFANTYSFHTHQCSKIVKHNTDNKNFLFVGSYHRTVGLTDYYSVHLPRLLHFQPCGAKTKCEHKLLPQFQRLVCLRPTAANNLPSKFNSDGTRHTWSISVRIIVLRLCYPKRMNILQI